MCETLQSQSQTKLKISMPIFLVRILLHELRVCDHFFHLPSSNKLHIRKLVLFLKRSVLRKNPRRWIESNEFKLTVIHLHQKHSEIE